MHKIETMNMFIRATVELPKGLKLATHEFREGWNLIRSGGAERLQRKMQTHGWNLVKSRNGYLRSGVGDTSQEAITNALKLALRQMSENFHAAEVENIHLTEYPWFFLAKVTMHQYCLLHSEVMPLCEEATPLTPALWPRCVPLRPIALIPDFASVIPQLRYALNSTQRPPTLSEP
jgi:hypothetical protein